MKTVKLSALIKLTLGTDIALLALMTAQGGGPVWASSPKITVADSANVLPPASVVKMTPPPPSASAPNVTPVAGVTSLLDERRCFALGMIETGNDDQEVGSLGEVSRYQIMPSVWSQYSSSRRYHDLETSTEVARQHWTALHDGFKQQAHREPTDFDMYVLWNTRYGYYARHGFKPAHLDPSIRDRAQRFVNLIQRGAS